MNGRLESGSNHLGNIPEFEKPIGLTLLCKVLRISDALLTRDVLSRESLGGLVIKRGQRLSIEEASRIAREVAILRAQEIIPTPPDNNDRSGI